MTSQTQTRPRADEVEKTEDLPMVTPTTARGRLRTTTTPLTTPTPTTEETRTAAPELEEPTITTTVPTPGVKRAAEEPVEEIDAARALQPYTEDTSMEIGTVEDLMHILEMELSTEENLEDDLEGLYMDDGKDWWPLAAVRQGDLTEWQGLFDKSFARGCGEHAA